MRGRLPQVTAREVVRVAERAGFRFKRQRGGHAIYQRDTDKARVVIPTHAGKTIKSGTLAGIIEDLGLSPEQFRDLL